MSTPHCPVCGRWNDPSGGPESHSSGCPNTGQPYPGQPKPEPKPRTFQSDTRHSPNRGSYFDRRTFPVKDFTHA